MVDPRLRPAVDQYEHPETSKDVAWLLAGGDVFPFTPRTATRDGVDFDHVCPTTPRTARRTGPHNARSAASDPAPLEDPRRVPLPRVRTGTRLWQTPHGACVLVDDTGSRRLRQDEATMMLAAPPGIDIYLADTGIDLSGYDAC